MPRSDSIQWKYRELLVDPYILSTVFLGKVSYNMLDPALIDELKELNEQLILKLTEIINMKLTERQKEVMTKIYFEQRTQMETADMLGVCQTTIHKIIAGNIDYQNNGKRYGGALKKIRRLCQEDESIQAILERIIQIRKEIDLG